MHDHTQHRPFDNLGGDLNGLSELMCRPNTAVGMLILDLSGSMQKHGDAPPKAVDKAVEALRKDESDHCYYVGIVGFADQMHVLQRIAPVSKITPLQGYNPKGDTALFSTVSDVLTFLLGQAVMAGERIAPDLFVAVAVFSDGDDNLSPGSQPLLHETAKAVRSRGWTLQSFGIGIDSQRLAQLLGFDPDIAITVRGSAAGIDDASTTFTNTMITRAPSRLISPSPAPPTDPLTDKGIRSDP